MKCPITGVNIPRFLVCVLAGFITLFVTDFIIHNILLVDTYNATKNLWRSPEEMASFFPFMLVGRFILAGIIAFMFARSYEGAGICNGLSLRFGYRSINRHAQRPTLCMDAHPTYLSPSLVYSGPNARHFAWCNIQPHI
jgi:hypothetical protein